MALFDLDGRFFTTMRMLVSRPGGLTEAWIRGNRTRFIKPLRLYLLSSAVLFGMLALPGFTLTSAVEGVLDGFTEGWTDNSRISEPALEALAGGDNPDRIAAAKVDDFPQAMFLLLPFAALLLKSVRRPARHYVVHLA